MIFRGTFILGHLHLALSDMFIYHIFSDTSKKWDKRCIVHGYPGMSWHTLDLSWTDNFYTWNWCKNKIPSGNDSHRYWKWQKWPINIVARNLLSIIDDDFPVRYVNVYERVSPGWKSRQQNIKTWCTVSTRITQKVTWKTIPDHGFVSSWHEINMHSPGGSYLS